MSDHLRLHVECATDAKLLAIGLALSCPAGSVVSTWVAVLTHAKSRRGSAHGFKSDVWAAFAGYQTELVDAIVGEFRRTGLIGENGRLTKWDAHNPTRTDRTAAARQKRKRDRNRAQNSVTGVTNRPAEGVTRVTKRASRTVTGVTHEAAKNVTGVTPETPENVTPVTAGGDASRCVTPRHAGGDYRGGAVDSSASSSNLNSPNHHTRDTRALDAGMVFDRLQAEGITASWAARAMNAIRIRSWCASGITAAQLDDAIDRAQSARRRQGSTQPLNVGYLAAHVDDVLAGREPRVVRSTSNRMEACDDAAATYLASRNHGV